MAQEIETKVLDIDRDKIVARLAELHAEKIKQTRLIVDWYRPKGVKEGEDPWFLRIRTDSSGKHEVTWKAISEILGTARKHKEINFTVSDDEKMADLFIELGLEAFGHQEKDRTSFKLKDWQFDLDEYPGMPAFIEIEGTSEDHVKEAMKLLGVEGNRTWVQGERMLIQQIYGLNWYDMKF
jgi:adenylate cyclase class 2